VTRRICSGCGHTLVQPRSDVDGVMGAHMDKHTHMHQQRGEACWWIVQATPEPARMTVRVVLLAVAAVLGAALAAFLTLTAPSPDDDSERRCVTAFETEIGAVTEYDRVDCRDGLADGKNAKGFRS